MTLNVKVGTFLATGVDESETTVTVGFQPKVVIFWSNGHTASGDTEHGSWAVGYMISPTDQGNITHYHLNNGTTTDRMSTWYNAANDAFEVTQSGGTRYVGFDAAATPFSSTGFTVHYWIAGVANTIVHYLALGGSDLTNVAGGEFNTPTTTGNYTPVTGLSFQPDLVIFLYSNLPTSGVIGGPGIGVAKSSTERWAWSQSNNSDGASMASGNTAFRILSTTRCLHQLATSTSIHYSHDFVSMNSDGFTLNLITAPAMSPFYNGYIALKGPEFRIGTWTKNTNTTDTTHTVNAGASATPLAYILTNVAVINTTAQSTGSRVSFGASDGTNVGCAAYEDRNGVLNTQVRRYMSNSSVMVVRAVPTSTSAAGATEMNMTHSSFTSTGFVLAYTTNGTTAAYISPYITIGPNPGGGGPTYTSSLTGSQSSATGTLVRVANLRRALPGAQPSATASLARSAQVSAAPITASQPASSAVLARNVVISRTLTGNQPISSQLSAELHLMDTMTPSGTTTDAAMTVAQEFWCDEDTTILEVGIYAGGSQSYDAYIWDMSGTLLASGSATAPSTAAWFYAPVTPVEMAAGTHFKVGYFIPAGRTIYQTPNHLDAGDFYSTTGIGVRVGSVGVNVDLRPTNVVLHRQVGFVGVNIDLRRTGVTIYRQIGFVGAMVDLRVV